MKLSPEFEYLRTWVVQLPNIFDQSGTELYRGRNVIKSFQIGDLLVVAKRFKRLDFFKGLIYTFFRSGKARRSYENAIQLAARGIATPAPIAYIENIQGGLLRDSFYLCVHTDYEELSTLMPAHGTTYPPALAKAFARFVCRLHQTGILHYDLNNGNVLFRQSPDGGFEFQLIDINRMAFMPLGQPVNLKESMENLTLFTGNMELHAFVLREYALARGLDVEAFVRDATAVKLRHDARWRLRKRLTHPSRWLKG